MVLYRRGPKVFFSNKRSSLKAFHDEVGDLAAVLIARAEQRRAEREAVEQETWFTDTLKKYGITE